ncbi:NUDIX hydrolase [Actinomadura fulvescens]|uniref:Uncharacterized protein n=1 Tax=Actinomadura fulvescens TaxID=46160 RepID=A0ABN3PZD0_9ACTN
MGTSVQGAESEIGIQLYSGVVLAEDSGAKRILADKAEADVRVRIPLGDPNSTQVVERGDDEGIGDTMASKIRYVTALYKDLRALANVEVPPQHSPLQPIYFAGDQLYVNTHVYGVPASDAPFWHLRRLPGVAIDLGGSVAQAVVLDTKEETGIDVEITGLVGIYSVPQSPTPSGVRTSFGYNQRIEDAPADPPPEPASSATRGGGRHAAHTPVLQPRKEQDGDMASAYLESFERVVQRSTTSRELVSRFAASLHIKDWKSVT